MYRLSMERFIKVEVMREQYSDVYLKIDDADPTFADMFNKENKLARGCRLPPLTLEHAVEETLEEYEWETDPLVSSTVSNEVTKEEATQYTVWDVAADEIYTKED